MCLFSVPPLPRRQWIDSIACDRLDDAADHVLAGLEDPVVEAVDVYEGSPRSVGGGLQAVAAQVAIESKF